MTEPDAGSDVQAIRTTARREGAHYVVNGSKTFITNGCIREFSALPCGPAGPGPEGALTADGRNRRAAWYRSAGRCTKSAGTTRIPASCSSTRVPRLGYLLGPGEGRGLFQIMDQLRYERLSIALSAVAGGTCSGDHGAVR